MEDDTPSSEEEDDESDDSSVMDVEGEEDDGTDEEGDEGDERGKHRGRLMEREVHVAERRRPPPVRDSSQGAGGAARTRGVEAALSHMTAAQLLDASGSAKLNTLGVEVRLPGSALEMMAMMLDAQPCRIQGLTLKSVLFADRAVVLPEPYTPSRHQSGRHHRSEAAALQGQSCRSTPTTVGIPHLQAAGRKPYCRIAGAGWESRATPIGASHLRPTARQQPMPAAGSAHGAR